MSGNGACKCSEACMGDRLTALKYSLYNQSLHPYNVEPFSSLGVYEALLVELYDRSMIILRFATTNCLIDP
ncbi:hypothetical protein VCHA53O466_50120 [Vibrio chagasii]|nr:hypothetical protein VCHA53O466_50120 [Vibrio chagasii]